MVGVVHLSQVAIVYHVPHKTDGSLGTFCGVTLEEQATFVNCPTTTETRIEASRPRKEECIL